MSESSKRDHAASLAKSRPEQALTSARAIKDPWYRAQALAWVARYSTSKSGSIAKESLKAARECDDPYKSVAVRAWIIAALAEAGNSIEARRLLSGALSEISAVSPAASKAEALLLLLQAATRVGPKERGAVHDAMRSACGHDAHWRAKRALRHAELIATGTRAARQFFW